MIAYGAKSANLGELIHARLPGFIVPPGFTIPFYYYDQFLRENKLDDAIYTMMNDQKFVHDPAYRREYLARVRGNFQKERLTRSCEARFCVVCMLNFPARGFLLAAQPTAKTCPISMAPVFIPRCRICVPTIN